jgi:hypothetical protein
MEIVRTATYSLQNTHPKEMAATIAIYRDAVEALAIIVRAEWVSIVACPKLNQREHLVEELVITTDPRKKREPKPKDGVVAAADATTMAPPKASAPPSNDTNPVDDGFVFVLSPLHPKRLPARKPNTQISKHPLGICRLTCADPLSEMHSVWLPAITPGSTSGLPNKPRL